MNRHYCLQTLLFGLLLLTASLAGAAEIQVSVDRNPVVLNDSFQITFTANEEPDGSPDFSPLQQNFEILNQQRSSNSSWVNGQTSRTEQWVVSVMAKQAGEALIPPIAFGADSSKPLTITVSESQDIQQANDDLFLDVSATPEKPYVQSQVLYTLKLYRRVHITQASLNEPEIKDAIVEKLGEDSNYTTQIKGVDYWVTERKYAIFPQQSGVFTIAPLMLNAEVVSSSQQPRFNGFFNRQTTETRRVSSKAITLNVQAVPSSFKGAAWLSAESLELSEKWSGSNLQTKVGEPLTRTLTLTAKGTTVGQLPELFGQAVIDGIKTYPDQPVLKEDKQSDGLTAMREEKVALIASKPGDYTLPALEITWFNTRTRQVETARLPAVTIKALASGEAAPSQPSVVSATPAVQPTASPALFSNGDILFWQGLAAALALGWLLTLMWFFRNPAKTSAKNQQAGRSLPEAGVEKNLKRACWENNPQAAKQALLQWGRARFGADSLGGIAQHCAEPLRNEIMELSRHLYSGLQQDWSGKALWQAFSETNRSQSTESIADDGLEPLYKL